MKREKAVHHAFTAGVICFTLLAPLALAGDGQIDIAELPYTITAPGSYIVVANLTLTDLDTDGITIETNNVTIDLNGHALIGPGKAAGSSGDGILAPGINHNNIRIHNGTVRDFRDDGIDLGGVNNQVSQVRVYDNGDYGIWMGSNATISDNCVRDNDGDGILVNGFAAVVRDNSVRTNGGDGINVLDGCTVIGNTSYGNTGNGIDADNSLVAENACFGNTAANIALTGGLSVDNYAP